MLATVKKDRTKSKQKRLKEKAKVIKQLKQIRENGDICAEDNQMVELLLKGINIVLINSKTDLRMGGTVGNELRATLESEL